MPPEPPKTFPFSRSASDLTMRPRWSQPRTRGICSACELSRLTKPTSMRAGFRFPCRSRWQCSVIGSAIPFRGSLRGASAKCGSSRSGNVAGTPSPAESASRLNDQGGRNHDLLPRLNSSTCPAVGTGTRLARSRNCGWSDPMDYPELLFLIQLLLQSSGRNTIDSGPFFPLRANHSKLPGHRWHCGFKSRKSDFPWSQSGRNPAIRLPNPPHQA
jgi:hypothetical protein